MNAKQKSISRQEATWHEAAKKAIEKAIELI